MGVDPPGDRKAPTTRTCGLRHAPKGLNAEPKLNRRQLEGEIFLLTFPFIEPRGREFEFYLASHSIPIRAPSSFG